MRTRSSHPFQRRHRHEHVPEKQIARWLDDGGADPEPLRTAPVPVMWSPVALNARLEAQQALHGLRPVSTAAQARIELRRIVTRVDRRELAQHAAITALRELTKRLRTYRAVMLPPSRSGGRHGPAAV